MSHLDDEAREKAPHRSDRKEIASHVRPDALPKCEEDAPPAGDGAHGLGRIEGADLLRARLVGRLLREHADLQIVHAHKEGERRARKEGDQDEIWISPA